MSIDSELQRRLHREMLRTRYLDEAHQKYIRQGRCTAMSHPATGQEAISAGITAALRQEDILYPTFRGFGDYLGKGMNLNALVAELMGRQGGVARGIGGTHFGDRAHNVHAGCGVLGAQFSIAVGSALALKQRGERRVVMLHTGEGAFNVPDSHAMMNLGAIWNLPLVIIVTNNQFVEFSYHDVHFPPKADGIGSRAGYYKIPNKVVDGNDVELVYSEAQAAVDAARAGQGPTLLEMTTCRMGGHYEADPLTYIDQELLARWRDKCPIDRCEAKLRQSGVMDQEAIAAAHEAAKKEVDVAFKLALKDKPADLAYLFDHLAETNGLL